MEVEQFSEPYEHFVFEHVLPDDLIDDALAHVPPPHAPWIRYENELERHKWTMEDALKLPAAWVMVMHYLQNASLVNNIQYYTGIPDLKATTRGAGLHVMFPGGYLQTHVDYALHPSGMERRANVILSFNDMHSSNGGATQLCDANGTVVKNVYLQRNEALVWACGDETYHGVEQLAPDSPVRYTAASYYLSPPRKGISRTRALFIPRR